jgi:hypothetical protein
MVLVSSPERSICGISRGLGAPWGVPKGLKDKRSGPLPYGPARQTVLSLCATLSIETIKWTARPPKPLPW